MQIFFTELVHSVKSFPLNAINYTDFEITRHELRNRRARPEASRSGTPYSTLPPCHGNPAILTRLHRAPAHMERRRLSAQELLLASCRLASATRHAATEPIDSLVGSSPARGLNTHQTTSPYIRLPGEKIILARP